MRSGVMAAMVALAAGCASSTGPSSEPICAAPEALPLTGESCVVPSAALAAHERGDEVIGWITGSFGPIRSALGLTGVEVRLLGPGQRVIPEVGSGGYATDLTVELQVDLDSSFDRPFQRGWVVQLLAHELHHVARLRRVGNPGTVGALVVFEGMADRFAVDYGARSVSPWSSALTGEELEAWVDRILDDHPQRDYSASAWLFGTTPDIPRWTGYTAGFVISGRYLDETGRSAAAAAADGADAIIATVRGGR
jgi:hypothetical protein